MSLRVDKKKIMLQICQNDGLIDDKKMIYSK